MTDNPNERCADCGDTTLIEDGYWVEANGLSKYDTFVIVCKNCSPNTEPVEWYSDFLEGLGSQLDKG